MQDPAQGDLKTHGERVSDQRAVKYTEKDVCVNALNCRKKHPRHA